MIPPLLNIYDVVAPRLGSKPPIFMLGADHDETLNIEMNIGIFPYKNPTASREDVLEAITVLDALGKRLVRILGIKHPKTFNVQAAAYQARQKLAAMEPPRRATLEDALAAFDL